MSAGLKSDKYGSSSDFAPPVTIPKGASFTDMIALKGKSEIGDKINTQIIQPLPCESADQNRLNTIKQYGQAAIPWRTPPEWRGKVIANLERFVTKSQFPSALSLVDAIAIVRGRVEEVLRPHREAEQAAQDAREAQEGRERKRLALIEVGSAHAVRVTRDWGWQAKRGACTETEKVLRREVQPDWTELEAEDGVGEILDEWVDDDLKE